VRALHPRAYALGYNLPPLTGLRKQHYGDHGFALVFTLLLLSMMSLMALAMVFSSSSDMLINGYYRNARGSFYAADSGLNMARQQLESQIVAQVPSTFTTNPIPTGAAATVLSSVLTAYASSTSLNAGQAANSWVESFVIPNTTACPTTFSLAPNSPTVTSTSSSTGQPTGYQYIYNYSLCVTGMAQGSEQTSVSETGSVILGVSGLPETTTTSFAAYGAFIDQYAVCSGAFVSGTMTGPFFTNGAFEFGTSGSYIFTDPVGQANADADFWFGNNCIQSPTSSYKSGTQTIKPTFEGNPPFSLGLNTEPLPPNDFSQQWAVLDGKGTGEGSSAPTAANMHSGNLPNYPPLQTASGTAYPTSGASSGLYIPYTTSGSVNTFDGGGFYVAGNASIALSTSGTSAQVFAISQTSGSTTTTTTITTDPLATPPTSWNCPTGTTGTTTVATKVGSGSTTTVNFCAVPTNQSVTPSQPGTIIYVNGSIASSCSYGGCTGGLSGPGQGVAGIQNYNAISIAANGNIDIEGDLIYATEPVTTTQNQIVSGTSPACCNGDPVDTLIPGHNNGQVLGIFTANGNINLNSNYSNNNLEVDAAMVAAQAGQSYGFTTNEGGINTMTNVGARTENTANPVSMNSANTYFDRRFTASPGLAPPWFPTTTVTASGAAPAVPKPTIQRVQWVLRNM